MCEFTDQVCINRPKPLWCMTRFRFSSTPSSACSARNLTSSAVPWDATLIQPTAKSTATQTTRLLLTNTAREYRGWSRGYVFWPRNVLFFFFFFNGYSFSLCIKNVSCFINIPRNLFLFVIKFGKYFNITVVFWNIVWIL